MSLPLQEIIRSKPLLKNRIEKGRPGGQQVTGFTPDMEEKQLEKYKMAFEVFLKYKKQITGITFWNISGRYS